MLKPTYPYYLANEAHSPNTDLAVTDKYSGEVATRVALADAKVIDQAIAAAVAAQEAMAAMPPYARQDVLNHCVKRFSERFEEIALALCIEAGKPIKDARGEVSRLIDTFRVGAEEAVRGGGEVMNLEIAPRAKGYRGMWKRVPIGPCSLISPFNFPLNLAAHKIAPAIAAGCTWVMKPASRTPIGALIIGEVLAETDLPKGSFSILPCSRDGADLFTEDERLKLLSFTGSPGVGWALKAKAGKKKVVLELGGNAAAVVDADQADNLDYVVERICKVQDFLGQRIAMENVSYYAAPQQEMTEIDFVNEVIQRADCDLLLDVNNIYVNSINHHYDAVEFLDAMPGDKVGYVHIAGHYDEAEDLRVDTHGADVIDPVWQLLDHAYERFGVMPTLLERDFNFPTVAGLIGEVEQIKRFQKIHTKGERVIAENG